MKKWLCIICGWIYDEAKGWPADGILPGTRWQDIPEDWLCPDCGVAKADFEMIEMSHSELEDTTATVAQVASPIVIIGSGYAGYSLAEAIRARSSDKEIKLFTADAGINYSKPALSNALAKQKSPQDLINETALVIEQRLNIRVHARCRVLSIETDKKLIQTDLGPQSYSKLILALGAKPLKIAISGDGAEDVLSVNDWQDYQVFHGRLEGIHSVTIIGTGLIGCEFANDLASRGYRVNVVGIAGWSMDRLMPQAIGEELQLAMSTLGVQFHLNNSIGAIEKRGNGYQVTLTNGEQFATDLVLSAVGLVPSIELAQAAGIECRRGIVVNGGLRTSAADVYGLGDCVEINGQLLPYLAPINHGIRALAECVLGRPTMAQYPVMPVIVKTPIYPLTLVAPAPNQEGEWLVEHESTGKRGLFYNPQQELKGFVLSGELVNERQQWMDKML